MMLAATANYSKLVSTDKKGRPVLVGTRYRVSLLAAEHFRFRWSAEDLVTNHPDLSRGQVDAALAYFYDHRSEVESEIAQIDRDWAEGRAQAQQPLPNELKARIQS